MPIDTPEPIMHTIVGADGKRVPILREDTFRKALLATEQAMRDDHRALEEAVERARKPA